MTLLSRKEFKKFYDNEVAFAQLRGITISQGHKSELEEMFSIYKHTTTNKDFTAEMANAGYGLI